MKAPWILLVPALYTEVFSHNIEQDLNSLDLSGNSYKCEDGMRPSIACTDPSSNNHNCSCTCTNGIVFEQPLPSPSEADGSSGSSLIGCQAGKNECLVREQGLIAELEESQQEHLKREQGLMAELEERQQEHLKREQGLMAELEERQQEHLKREQELSAELSTCKGKPFIYQGCYTDSANRVLSDSFVIDAAMTVDKCAITCQNFTHYGVQYGNACLCGNVFKQNTEKVAEGECNMQCSGNAKQKCGGVWRNSMYSKTI